MFDSTRGPQALVLPGLRNKHMLLALFLWKSKSSANMFFHFADVEHLKVSSFPGSLLNRP